MANDLIFLQHTNIVTYRFQWELSHALSGRESAGFVRWAAPVEGPGAENSFSPSKK